MRDLSLSLGVSHCLRKDFDLSQGLPRHGIPQSASVSVNDVSVLSAFSQSWEEMNNKYSYLFGIST